MAKKRKEKKRKYSGVWNNFYILGASASCGSGYEDRHDFGIGHRAEGTHQISGSQTCGKGGKRVMFMPNRELRQLHFHLSSDF